MKAHLDGTESKLYIAAYRMYICNESSRISPLSNLI